MADEAPPCSDVHNDSVAAKANKRRDMEIWPFPGFLQDVNTNVKKVHRERYGPNDVGTPAGQLNRPQESVCHRSGHPQTPGAVADESHAYGLGMEKQNIRIADDWLLGIGTYPYK